MEIASAPRTKEKSLLLALGVIPAIDHIATREFLQVENQSEEKVDRVREPAQKFPAAMK
jgi:hypothetical protein